MKGTTVILIVFALFTLLSCRDTGTNTTDDDSIYLSGTVKDPNGNPISGASVYIVFDWNAGITNRSDRDPVVIINMLCTRYPDHMIFYWTTQSETNLSGFNILYGNPSLDQDLGSFIPATNSSTPHNYTYDHSEYIDDQFWLKISDLDGNTQLAGPFPIEDTLPVELSSFWATLTANNDVRVHWVTQSEVNLGGFYVLRGITSNMENAIQVSQHIAATNTSQEQNYEFIDTELGGPGTYYYWLQVQLMDGTSNFFGPCIIYVVEPPPPVIPEFFSASIYPNPSAGQFHLQYALPQNCNVKIYVTCELPYANITLFDGIQAAGTYIYIWNGTNSNGYLVSNGRYDMVIKATNNLEEVLFQETIYLFKNSYELNSLPVVSTSANGYSINMNKFCQWDKIFDIIDETGQLTGTGLPGGKFWIYVKKDGYQTASRYINLSEYGNQWITLTEDFILQPVR